MAAKTTAQRQDALRKRRAALGLKRLELYSHPEDHPELKSTAVRLQQHREKKQKAKED